MPPVAVAPDRRAVIVDGVRTPFLKSNGAFKDLMAHDLGRIAIAGLLAKTGLPPALVELVEAALEPDPERRIRGAGEFLRRLQRAVRDAARHATPL